MDFKKEFEVNKATWNEKALVHYESDFYDVGAFAKAQNSLTPYELQTLGNVDGKSLLHLQCHFGQDTLSWAKKGAKATGVDFSEKAIEIARNVSKHLKLDAQFVCCNVLDTASYIDQKFDIVVTSYGVIGWLPDLKPWASMISKMLKPGGTFYIAEFHPIVWMYDYTSDKPILKYHYNQSESIYEEYPGTYANPESDMISKEYGWNHALSDVIQSLIDAGLKIELFAEHDGSPYDVFPNMEKRDDGLYYFKDGLFPTIFEVKAVKP